MQPYGESELGRAAGKQMATGREANLALLSERFYSRRLAARLADRNIAVDCGNVYARRLLDKIGADDLGEGVLRISMAHYNTESEVERLIEALADLH